jgi:AmiR/NasT family two-component response regulator
MPVADHPREPTSRGPSPETPSEQPAAPGGDRPGLAPNRILIVEDERLVAEDLRDCLTHFGYDVVGIVASGEKAIDRVAELRPDLVLMDIHLSGQIDGVTAGGVIRMRHGTPVVYLTAFSNDQTLARARETDAFGFIVKPFQEKGVIAAIEMALGKHLKERAHRQREEMLRSGLMTLPLGVIMTDENGRIVFANSTARLHIGRSLDAEGGVPLDDVFLRSISSAGGNEPREGSGAIMEMTGRRLEVAYSEESLRGDNSRVIGRILIYQDAVHPPFQGELGRLLRAFMRASQSAPMGPEQFVTICAWSKRIKVDDAKWVSFEDFLKHYLGLNVTHGMSPEVADKWVTASSDESDDPAPPSTN